MTTVTVYSTSWCPWCDRAKALLNARGIAYEDVNIETEPDFRRKLVDLTGGYTVPQIVVVSMRMLPPAPPGTLWDVVPSPPALIFPSSTIAAA